ncbi:MAG: hypothetical protein K8L99_00665 [Anaerolineae bacterium]|nr:hypothetical protein [Anaerolineae bacterium]
MSKPGRPLGLSIAIFVSALLFAILPLVQVAFYLSVYLRFRNIEFLEGGGASGADILGLSGGELILQTVVSLIFLVIAVLAWRGKPARIRMVFVGAVIIMTLATIVATVLAFNAKNGAAQGFDSGAVLADSLLQARLIFTLLVAAYVLWYVNRGPARAFYRGYYLEAPEEETADR